MRSCVVFLALCLTWIDLVKAVDHKIVCYFGSWSVYRHGNGKFAISDIDPTLCTHMIYTFVGITEIGDVRVLDPWGDLAKDGGLAGFQKFNSLRNKSSITKTLVGIGGWNEGSVKYSKIVGDSTLRSKFVDNAVKFVIKYGFDGFDVDWEYPNQRGGTAADVKNHVLLLKQLRQRFDKHGLLLTAAVGAAETSASLSYDIPGISKYLDFINLMTYDFHGKWESFTGHNAPLYPAARETDASRGFNVNATVHYWLKQGAPPAKIILGTGLYGRSFTLRNAAQNVPGSPSTGGGRAGPYTGESGTLGYNEICEMEAKGSWTSVWDDEQHVPYAYSGDQWVGYDNVKSITEKAEFVKTMKLGGAMVWSVETDDFRGICGEKYPLLNALNRVLRGSGSRSMTTEGSLYNYQVTEHPTTVKTDSGNCESSTSSLVVVPSDVDSVSPRDVEQNYFPANSDDGLNLESADDGSNIDCEQTEGKYVRDPKDCSKFWICQRISLDTLKPVSLMCGEGLYFDTRYSVCNYANAVEC